MRSDSQLSAPGLPDRVVGADQSLRCEVLTLNLEVLTMVITLRIETSLVEIRDISVKKIVVQTSRCT